MINQCFLEIGMNEIGKVIDSPQARTQHIVLREGYPFTCILSPINVFDAILIKPNNAQCFCPNFINCINVDKTIEEYIGFINKYGIDKAYVVADNIDFLEKCPSLKYIKIIPSDNAGDRFDYSPLEKLPCVLYLDCATKYGKNFANSTTIDYSKISSVQSINLEEDGHINTNTLKALKTCYISRSDKRNLSEVINSKNIDSIAILQCKFKGLDGIQAFEKLSCLSLSYNKSLEDLTLLEENSKTLMHLAIENCPKIKDFSFLEKLENLEVLTIHGKNTLPNLNFIKKLKKLRVFAFDVEVLDGDLTPCRELEHVFSFVNRKHYNLKNDELPKTKGKITCCSEIEEWRRICN